MLISEIEVESLSQQIEFSTIETKQSPVLQSLLFGSLFFNRPIHEISKLLIRCLITPIRPGIEGNGSTYLMELMTRIFSVTIGFCLLGPFLAVALVGSSLEVISDRFRNTPYLYLEGKAGEKIEEKEKKWMTLNSCMLQGGLPLAFGGIRPATERMENLVQLILRESPDILVMQEVTFESGYKLFQKLQNHYRHFFTRIGPNPPFESSGLFLVTKTPILREGFVPFRGQWGMNRGAFWIETQDSYLITTHLQPGMENSKLRSIQLQIIKDLMESFPKGKPAFLMGDLNVDRAHTTEYADLKIDQYFHDPYFAESSIPTEQNSTCTNVIGSHMLGQQAPPIPFELVDYVLLKKDTSSENLKLKTTLISTYDTNEPYKAISDHRGLVLTISKKES